MKNDTKEMIRQAAVSEFMDKGFAGASLRKIVKNAGVTTGAFYKYYPTKEALFAELVEEHAEHIYNIYDEILANFEELSPEEQTARMKETSRDGINEMLDYVYEHYDNFKLLLCKSEGTPFTSFIHNIVEREVASTDRYIELMRKSGKDMPYIDPELQHMIASGQFSGVFEIVVHDMEKEAAIRKVSMLKEFYTAGWERLFLHNKKTASHTVMR